MTAWTIFVLDGPDGVGKTSLAKQIGGHYLHCVYNDNVKNDIVSYMDHIIKAAEHLSHHSHVVIDRWVMSESVYSNVYREGKSDIDNETRQYFYSRAIHSRAVFIHCLPSNKKQYLESFDLLKKDRTEMYVDGMDRVYEEYVVQMRETRNQLNPYFYDRFHHSIIPFTDDLIRNTLIKR